ncbi:hypothetical protein SALBM217S_07124 [Streptomyces griseoloalbus]
MRSFSPKPLVEVVDLHDDVAQARARRDLDLLEVQLPHLVGLGGHLLVAGQTRLRLGLAPLGVGAHPLQLFLEPLLPLGVLLALDLEAGGLGLQVLGVVALVGVEATASRPRRSTGRRCPGSTRSWVTATTVPGYWARCCSSQFTDSASRWLVGSSSSSRSGCSSRSLHSATRRFSPPDRLVTGQSPGRQPRASMACSSCASRSHALAWSSCSWSLPISSMSSSVYSVAICSAISLNRSSLPLISATPSWTFSRTVLSSVRGGSWSRMPTV